MEIVDDLQIFFSWTFYLQMKSLEKGGVPKSGTIYKSEAKKKFIKLLIF